MAYKQLRRSQFLTKQAARASGAGRQHFLASHAAHAYSGSFCMCQRWLPRAAAEQRKLRCQCLPLPVPL